MTDFCILTPVIHFAPVQGHTDAPFRVLHARHFGGADTYYSPFIRWEREGIRPRDLKDIDPDANHGTLLVPQVIFRDAHELHHLIDILVNGGAAKIDINMGCPFPLQTGHGRGAATVARADLAQEVRRITEQYPLIDFSVKMRLGLHSPDEWEAAIPHLSEARLTHITMHPRIAVQQYNGAPDFESFGRFMQANPHPTVYNGDIRTPQDAAEIMERFPGLSQLMIGRGLLARPSLAYEIKSGKELPRPQRISKTLAFHNALLAHYRATLCGDAQVLSKIKPFWEYAEDEIGRKPWKNIRKAVNMAKYLTAIASIAGS